MGQSRSLQRNRGRPHILLLHAPIQVLSQLIFRGNATLPAHRRAPSFSHCSVEGWADLLHPVTPLKLLLADNHHQRGEMSQSCAQPDRKHSQGEAAQPRWKREVTAPGMLSAAHGASAADTLVSKASFRLGFVQGFYFAELLCFSFLSCNLSL